MPAGASWGVASFVYNATPGLTVTLSKGSVNLNAGQPEATITASVLATGISPGSVVRIDVTNATAPVPVVIRGGPVRAYMIAPPSTVRIDGLLADWVGRDQIDSDPVPVKNPDVDILRYGAAVNTSAVYFHVSVAGDLMAGQVPDRFIRIPPGQGGNASGGPPVPLPRRTGEDILRAYIDLNSTDAAGVPVDGIYADYLIEVRGVAGRITTQALYRWAGSWASIPSPGITLAKNATDVEGSIALGPTTNTTRMVFEATDWSSGVDWAAGPGAPSFALSWPFAVGTRALESPRTFGFEGSAFYLRDAGPLIFPSDCPVVKGLNMTQGTLAVPLPLSTGSKPCFFTAPAASNETIHAGLWSSSLDLSSSNGTALKITFAITQMNGTFLTLVCENNTSTNGGVNQTFACAGPDISIGQNQRVRLQIEFVAGDPIVLSYDGTVTSQDSSILLPVPEFGEMFVSTVAVGTIILSLSCRRRRRIG